ncbi:serine/threonine-protein phosphatase [Hamiltosporidium magnivora]|uniref:Serine/threonine-protein phosphatase n=1 Tax=Hamiltosporidium magnivora TaxID=148818 RepID=A0A4Q9LEL4_9MICR|nr:serine/threonine-protein phosphatase [Hamiltosporidium magnivora]
MFTFVFFVLLFILFEEIGKKDSDPFLKMKIDIYAIRAKGNNFFKTKQYDKALETYYEGIECDTTDFPHANKELSILHLNISVTHYLMENFAESSRHALESLKYGRSNKAIYKLCNSYLKLGRFYQAKMLFETKGREFGEYRDPIKDSEKNFGNSELEYSFKGGISNYIENILKNFSLTSTSPFNKFFENIENNTEKTPFLKDEPFFTIFIEDSNILKYSFLNIFVTEIQKGNYVPAKVVVYILRYSYSILFNLDNIVKISNKENQRIIVFGDTHGNFIDIVNVLQQLISGNSKDIYLFNGDFVDRGSLSVENILLILVLKMVFPDQVFLNRGNHEFPAINQMMGFYEEIKVKYSLTHNIIFQSFCEVYKCMPLASILNNSVFVVHGGLPEERFYINDAQKIFRHTNDSYDKIFEGFMWSDPMEGFGVTPSKRNIAVNFGKDITERFLKDNNLTLIVRSHEYVCGGFKINQNGKVVTIFSAPNYCGMKGGAAYLVFEDKSDKYKVVNFG